MMMMMYQFIVPVIYVKIFEIKIKNNSKLNNIEERQLF